MQVSLWLPFYIDFGWGVGLTEPSSQSFFFTILWSVMCSLESICLHLSQISQRHTWLHIHMNFFSGEKWKTWWVWYASLTSLSLCFSASISLMISFCSRFRWYCWRNIGCCRQSWVVYACCWAEYWVVVCDQWGIAIKQQGSLNVTWDAHLSVQEVVLCNGRFLFWMALRQV